MWFSIHVGQRQLQCLFSSVVRSDSRSARAAGVGFVANHLSMEQSEVGSSGRTRTAFASALRRVSRRVFVATRAQDGKLERWLLR